MSKITLTPNASGTGTFTVASPNSNTNRTLTLPDAEGNLVVNTGTGVDITGTLTSDGLTVAGITTVQDNDLRIDLTAAPSASGEVIGDLYFRSENSYGGRQDAGLIRSISASNWGVSREAAMEFHTTYNSTMNKRMRINNNGDISFYEDTGTTAKFFWDASVERLGLGTTSPNVQLKLEHANRPSVALKDLSTNDELYITVENDIAEFNAYTAGTGARVPIVFTQYTDERMRIDSSGNLLVGTTSFNPDNAGIGARGSDGLLYSCRSNGSPALFNRKSSDGAIALFRKDGADVGSIGVTSTRTFIASDNGSTGCGLRFRGTEMVPVNRLGSDADNTYDLGFSNIRFDDIYATNGTIQTSDRNEKQDIEALSDAEQRVAVACKGLLRKFRWIDAVAEKGDDARIHFGIIAQDLQDAFAAEGLDAGRYAMFISSTWWETQTEVPAVEAVEAVEAVYEDVVIPAVEEELDEEGNVIAEAQPERTEQRLVTEAVEAVEAKEAYTRTDTYETLEEAPEGATERTRLGVRYPELLAFIIGAM